MENKDQLRRYLLGDLPEREQAGLQKEKLGESLHCAETDLIDAYVRQELSEEEQERFETDFLQSEERLMRLEMARLLMNPKVRAAVSVSPIQEKVTSAPWWQFLSFRIALASVGLAALVAIAFLVVHHQPIQNQSAQSKPASSNPQQQANTSQQPQPQPQASVASHSQTSVATFVLTPGMLRDGSNQQGNIFKLPAGTTAVDLILKLDPSIVRTRYSHFDVVLETVEGTKLQTLQNLESEQGPDGGTVVRVRIPARVLAEGDYIADIEGRAAGSGRRVLGAYSFSVVRKM